jgi:5'-3' exonuclease
LIYLVDASVYVFRAYHSMMPDRVDRDGNPVHAVFGFARFLGDLIERVRPRYMAVAFDQRLASSYRSRIYPAYKANREPAPVALKVQFQHCRELCGLLGLPAFVSTEYEADDIIGTLGCLMREEGIRSAYITRDKDLSQLVRSGDLYWDFGARDPFGYHDIERHFGVRPERFADYLALTGDEVLRFHRPSVCRVGSGRGSEAAWRARTEHAAARVSGVGFSGTQAHAHHV